MSNFFDVFADGHGGREGKYISDFGAESYFTDLISRSESGKTDLI